MTVQIIRGNALALPLADASVDLIVTSPPYFGLRSYQDGGTHYAGQIGDEPTPAEFVDALIAATAEMARVLKPCGSIWVNLGDKYASSSNGTIAHRAASRDRTARASSSNRSGVATKSLLGIPWRYAIRCVDELGLILRAEVIWDKPNGLPESVTDRVRRSHEQWFHFTREPRYFSAVDEVREPHAPGTAARAAAGFGSNARHDSGNSSGSLRTAELVDGYTPNPLGKLPGSVWTIPTEPLHVPDHLGIDHFAAFPTEFPRRIVQGWSPSGICTECGEGRRPVVGHAEWWARYKAENNLGDYLAGNGLDTATAGKQRAANNRIPEGPKTVITGESCACPEPTAPTRPAIVLDPFGGTGTTALVAHALGRHGISNDMSADYCRLAEWRTSDPKQIAKAARREYKPSAEKIDGQLDLLEGIA